MRWSSQPPIADRSPRGLPTLIAGVVALSLTLAGAHARAAVVFPLSSLAPPELTTVSKTPEARCVDTGGVLAAHIAPPALLGGDGFTVAPCAMLDGGVAIFQLSATDPEGQALEPATLSVEGLDLLELRVAEMDALRRLQAMGSTATTGRAAADSLLQTGDALAGVATRPVESLVGLPAGMLRVFGRRSAQISRQAANAGSAAMGAFDDEDPIFDTALRPRFGEAIPAEPAPWWQRGGSATMSLGKRWLGYSAARRDLGRELNLDPYTSNPWLNAVLDRLAWSALVGRRGVGLGLGQISGTAGLALGQGTRIHRMVWDAAPEEVSAWNAARLAPLDCTPAVQARFLDNARYSPTLQTRAVDALLALAPQDGCDAFLTLAASVRREAEARFVVDMLHLWVAARPRFPVRFETFGEAIVLRDGGERLWLALPVDLLAWTPENAAFFADTGFTTILDKRALIGRDASPKARSALASNGWAVVEQAMGPAREFSAATVTEAGFD